MEENKFFPKDVNISDANGVSLSINITKVPVFMATRGITPGQLRESALLYEGGVVYHDSLKVLVLYDVVPVPVSYRALSANASIVSPVCINVHKHS